MTKKSKPGVRALARELHRSPSHICRVLRGERQSMRLAKLLKRRGIKVKEARKAGCSHTHLRKVLEGERKPSADLERRMRRLGLKPGEMAKEGK